MDITDEQKKFWSWMEFFRPEEFESPDEPGSGLKMNTEFLRALHYLRIACKFPFKIDSGYRTESHNRAVGGEKNSAHMRGMACDIMVDNSCDRFTIIDEALKLGFKRVGIGKTFVHLDMDQTLTQGVIWNYYK